MKHRYRIAVLLCLQFLMINASFSQRRDNGYANHVKLKSFNLELLGNALGYSLNYDCLSIIDKKTAWSYRLGFAYYTNLQEHWLAFPLELNGLRGKNGHYFEVGIGILPNFEVPFVPLDKSLIVNYRVGYRYQRPDSRFMFRIATTPADYVNFDRAHSYSEFVFQPCFGVAFGYSFDPYRKARNKSRVRFRASPLPN